MKSNLLKSIVLIIATSSMIFLESCSKEEEKIPPVINFKPGPNYTLDGEEVMVGNKLLFGIQAQGNGANITNFTIKKLLVDGTSVTVMDTGLNAESLNVDKIYYQSVEEEVEWTFTVMDKNRMSSQISLTVFKDPDSQFGGIYYYPSITMGYQYNTEFGHFLDPFTGKVYFEDSATILQNNMHFLVYYIVDEDLPCPVFSSPGEMDNFSTEAKIFYPCIIDWQMRRYTLWDISVDEDPIPVEAFDQAFNDSLLIVSYDDVWGKKKFKWATNGRIIPFQTADGKFGLVKVLNAEHAENGKIEFSIKIQQ